MTTANKITLVRIVLIPIFMAAMLLEMKYAKTVALAIFILAGSTDWIDGYIARKYNQVTSFGKFMDPLADKLLVTAAILIFVQWGQMPAWAVMVIIAREFAVTGLRLVSAGGGVVIAAGMSGKVKTFTSMVGICVMLTPLHRYEIIAGILTVNTLIIWLMVITTVWSGGEYFAKNHKMLLENK